MTNLSTDFFTFSAVGSYYNSYKISEENLLTTKTKIQSFSEFPEGWCYGEGLAFSAAVLGIANELYESTKAHGLLTTDAFPGPEGEIRFKIYYKDTCLVFTINPNLMVNYVRENGGQENQPDNITLDKSKRIIQNYAEELWSLDCFQSTGTTGTKTSLKTGHSNHQIVVLAA